jgi:RND family efflux transporter MFP subunit
MKRYLTAAVLAVVALIVVVLLARRPGHTEESGSAAAPPPVVFGPADVAAVERADLAAGVPVAGTLDPAVKVQVIAPYPEVLAEVRVREGQAVRRGEVIARFRADALKLAVSSADARRRTAASNYERMQNLFKEGAVAARDVEDAEVALRAAEAEAAAAENRLEDAIVRSPVAGTISRREVDSGDRVGDGAFMFEIVNTDELEFEATVPSEHVSALRVGSPVALAGQGLPSSGVVARVARINATADPATRQVKVYVSVPNRESNLVAGLFASGRVVLREAPNAVAVPSPAVRREENGGQYVLVVDSSRIARRDVVVGVVDELRGLTEVTSGVAPGDLVVIGPAEGLMPGQPVTLTGRED